MEEGITLDDNDQKHMDNKLEDFWEDLTERQGETALGISRKDAKKTIQRIAYAQKYQEVYAQLHNRTYDDYAYMEDSYQKLLKKQKYNIQQMELNGQMRKISKGHNRCDMSVLSIRQMKR